MSHWRTCSSHQITLATLDYRHCLCVCVYSAASIHTTPCVCVSVCVLLASPVSCHVLSANYRRPALPQFCIFHGDSFSASPASTLQGGAEYTWTQNEGENWRNAGPKKEYPGTGVPFEKKKERFERNVSLTSENDPHSSVFLHCLVQCSRFFTCDST